MTLLLLIDLFDAKSMWLCNATVNVEWRSTYDVHLFSHWRKANQWCPCSFHWILNKMRWWWWRWKSNRASRWKKKTRRKEKVLNTCLRVEFFNSRVLVHTLSHTPRETNRRSRCQQMLDVRNKDEQRKNNHRANVLFDIFKWNVKANSERWWLRNV